MYLLTDQAVAETASRHVSMRPDLDLVSLQALDERADWQSQASAAERGAQNADDAESGPEALLWAALSLAPAEGVPIADLVAAIRMSQRWVHYRLRALASAGRAAQVKRGIWRVIEPGE